MISIDVSLVYRLGPERTALLTLEAARIGGQDVHSETFDIEHAELHHIEGQDGIGRRNWTMVEVPELRVHYEAEVKVTRKSPPLARLDATPLSQLPTEIVTYLRPSRYCQSDLFEDIAAQDFGSLAGGARITAIRDWVRTELAYAPGHSDGATTMLDTYKARRGVCRDFVHVFCGLARAANIPARYVAAYGPDVDPPDFHAVAEVWLDGAWHLLDPTGMCDPDEIVVIGVGRDAADVPFMETPDRAEFVHQSVRVTRG